MILHLNCILYFPKMFFQEKLWTKNLLLSLENEVYFFKDEKSNFFDQTWTEITEIIFPTLCKKFKILPFILFEKRRLAQGIRRPKAANFPLPINELIPDYSNVPYRFNQQGWKVWQDFCIFRYLLYYIRIGYVWCTRRSP